MARQALKAGWEPPTTYLPAQGGVDDGLEAYAADEKLRYAVYAYRSYVRDVLLHPENFCKTAQAGVLRMLIMRSSPSPDRLFVPAAAANALRFFRLLPLVDGKAQRRAPLMPFLVFMLVELFGWVSCYPKGSEEDDDDADLSGSFGSDLFYSKDWKKFKRYFKELRLWVPRGSAKSWIASAIGLYKLVADGEFAPSVYCAASTAKQARQVFDYARKLLAQDKDLCTHYGIVNLRNSIRVPSTEGDFVPLSSAGTNDGLLPSCFIVDELHQHKNSNVWDAATGAMPKRTSGALRVLISTAGMDLSSFAYQIYLDDLAVLTGEIEDPRRLVMIYTADPEDEWDAPQTIRKCSPAWGITQDPVELTEMQAVAKTKPDERRLFQTKHLNRWVSSATEFIDLKGLDSQRCTFSDSFMHATIPSLSPNPIALNGRSFTVGLDLSNTQDITAVACCFPVEISGETHYLLNIDSFTSDGAIHKIGSPAVQSYALNGYFHTISPGDVISHGEVISAVEELAQIFPGCLEEVAYDPYNANVVVSSMQACPALYGIRSVLIPQTSRSLSAPLKTLSDLFLLRRVWLVDSPLARYYFQNLLVRADRLGAVSPARKSVKHKIDGAMASLYAFKRAYELETAGKLLALPAYTTETK